MTDTNAEHIEKHEAILSFRDLSESTVKTYVSYMRQLLEWAEGAFPSRDIADLSWEELRSYFAYLKDVRHLKPRTINVHIAQLRDFFLYVLHKDWNKYQIPCMRVDERLPIVPTKPQVLSIIDAIDNPKHKAEISLLYSSGMRVSELVRLKCGDIYSGKEVIYVAVSKNRSDRYAVLSKKAYGHLVDYVRSDYKGATKDDPLFPGQRPGSAISTESVRLVFRSTLEKLGMQDRGYTLHSLRHAFGLHLYEAGTDLMSIKEAMGHKSLSSTTVYLTLGLGNGRKVVSPYDSSD